MERVPLNVHTANCVTVHDVIANLYEYSDITTTAHCMHQCAGVSHSFPSVHFVVACKGFQSYRYQVSFILRGRGSRLPLGLT